jgi:hypothetical protein
MNCWMRARIRWLAPASEGRASPPLGPTYSTVARFASLADRWPIEAWSIVLEISAPAEASGEMTAGIRLLAGDDAPKGLLSPGARFDLFEGTRLVANGEVL